MDNELQVVSSDDIPSPTTTGAELTAAEVMALIDAIAAQIPALEEPHPSTASSVRGARTVSRDAIIAMIAAVEHLPELQALESFDVDDARAMLQFESAFKPVLTRLRRLTARVSYAIEARKARVVFALLRTYAVAKGLARDPTSAPLVPYLDALRRELGRSNGSGAPAEE